MKKDLGQKTLVYPMPVLVVATYDENGVPDAMTAAWGGIADDNQIAICIAEDHKTTANLRAHPAFTVAITDAKNVKIADTLGTVSANDVPDKVARLGLHVRKSAYVDAPVIEEFPLVLECRLLGKSGYGQIVGEIVNVAADEAILDEKGRIDIEKLTPIAFDPVGCAYRKIGEKVAGAFEGKLD